MSAEDIAKVVHDITTDHYQRLTTTGIEKVLHDVAVPACRTVVNATAIYDQLAATVTQYNYYDDYPSLAPPWNNAAIVYENQHGNVVVMCILAVDKRTHDINPWEPDPQDNKTVDWDRVRWVMEVPLYLGGRGGAGPVATKGPAHLWRFAVYDTGELADVRWVQLVKDYPVKHWDMALLTFLSTINFMGCRNVELVPAQLPRAQRRRIERTAPEVRLGVLAVRSVAKRSTGRTGANPAALPMTSVVGHPVHYGDCCPERHDPKGLLFGKLEGRFWVPQHARGQREAGEVRNDYILEPEVAE